MQATTVAVGAVTAASGPTRSAGVIPVGDRTAFDCVAEQLFRLDAGDFLERGAEIWHVARTRGRDADFAPIRCSEDEGIVFHGGISRREPTCPDCRRIVGLDDRTPLAPGPRQPNGNCVVTGPGPGGTRSDGSLIDPEEGER